ncbi:hypothetical protein GCM10009761_32330 [Agromyces terreus]
MRIPDLSPLSPSGSKFNAVFCGAMALICVLMGLSGATFGWAVAAAFDALDLVFIGIAVWVHRSESH